MSFLIGQGIGRWGNFTNQEAFGTNTELPWGMWSPKTAQYITQHQSIFAAKGLSVEAGTYAEKAYVHPTFLYESLWCLLGFLVIYLICKKFRKFSGQLFLCYGIWYGMGRMVIEGFRTDSLYVGNSIIRVSQLLSAVIVVISLVALIVLLNKYKKNPKPIEGIDYFPDENDADKTSVEVDVALGNEENEAMETVQIINGQINGENDDAEVSENGKDN